MIAREKLPRAMAVVKRQRELLRAIDAGMLAVGLTKIGASQVAADQLAPSILEHYELALELVNMVEVTPKA